MRGSKLIRLIIAQVAFTFLAGNWIAFADDSDKPFFSISESELISALSGKWKGFLQIMATAKTPVEARSNFQKAI